MNKIEKQIINAKRQVWHEEKKAEFKALFPDVVELDEAGNELESFSEAFGKWLQELEQYEVTNTETDEEGNEVEVTNTYSRPKRPMPRFSVTKAELEAYNKVIYTELRANEYPDIANYIDGIVKGDNEQVQAYIDACLAIKEKYPKPNEG